MVIFLQDLQVGGQVGLSWTKDMKTLKHLLMDKTMAMKLSCQPLPSPSPVTVVPQGQSSMAPWLWACSSTQGCWALRANSTDTLNLPRSRPLSDTVTRESGNTHSCSSAGSERSGSDFSWVTSLFHREHLLFSARFSWLSVRGRSRDVPKPGGANSQAHSAWVSLLYGHLRAASIIHC